MIKNIIGYMVEARVSVDGGVFVNTPPVGIFPTKEKAEEFITTCLNATKNSQDPDNFWNNAGFDGMDYKWEKTEDTAEWLSEDEDDMVKHHPVTWQYSIRFGSTYKYCGGFSLAGPYLVHT